MPQLQAGRLYAGTKRVQQLSGLYEGRSLDAKDNIWKDYITTRLNSAIEGSLDRYLERREELLQVWGKGLGEEKDMGEMTIRPIIITGIRRPSKSTTRYWSWTKQCNCTM